MKPVPYKELFLPAMGEATSENPDQPPCFAAVLGETSGTAALPVSETPDISRCGPGQFWCRPLGGGVRWHAH